MKKIYYILLSLVIIGFNSCNDMLDMRPISEQTTGNFYQTQAHMESAVAAMYNGLRDYHTQDKFRLAMCPADNIEVGGAGYDEGPGGITKYITLSSNFVVLDYWQEAYSSIHRCNVVMERADGVEYDDTDLKTQHIAEARFIRGLIYYDLVRFFAGVPLITESRALEEYYQIPRSSEEEIWNFAQLELEYAAANLPAEINGSGRANKFALQLLSGHGSRRRAEAIERLNKAASLGHGDAAWRLVRIYERGFPKEINHSAALRMLRLAVENHQFDASKELAFRYEDGKKGVAKDLAKAVALYEATLAAANDNRYGWDLDRDNYNHFAWVESRLRQARAKLKAEIASRN